LISATKATLDSPLYWLRTQSRFRHEGLAHPPRTLRSTTFALITGGSILWQSQPVLARLHRAMELIRRKTLPQGLLGQAIDYTLKRWEALNQFIEDGTLEIDNNLIENAIRPSALGKKNWLFVGHPEAGERSAVIYTLLGSCRRHGINPFEYLKDLFTRLPAAKITQIKEFTPAAWAKAKAKEQLVALTA
jgi:hypothetical protein